MTATAVLDQTITVAGEPVYKIMELSDMGFGHHTTIRRRLHEANVPVDILDGRGTVGVRESFLPFLQKPVRGRLSVPQLPQPHPPSETPPAPSARPVDLDGLAVKAAQIVASWPRLSAERKAELGRLLVA